MSERSEMAYDARNMLRECGFESEDFLVPVFNGKGFFRSVSFNYHSAIQGRIEIWSPGDIRVYFLAVPAEWLYPVLDGGERFTSMAEALEIVIGAVDYVDDDDDTQIIQAVDDARLGEDINIGVAPNPVPVVKSMRITYEIDIALGDMIKIQPVDGGFISLVNEGHGSLVMNPSDVRQVIDALTMALDNIGEAV